MFTLTLLAAATEGPAPEDVKAGWVALIIFLLLALSVAFLGFSLTKHLRRAEASKDLGLYGDEPADGSAQDDSPRPGGPAQSS